MRQSHIIYAHHVIQPFPRNSHMSFDLIAASYARKLVTA
jgi:hypothetical protein